MRTRADRNPGRGPLRALVAALALTLLTACGGGGGGGGPTGPVIIDGLAGTVLLPDYDLGRINEQEPNDGPAQVFRLPPVWPRCALEVAGTLSSEATWYGRADTTDVLAFTCVEAQQVALGPSFGVDSVVGSSADVASVGYAVAVAVDRVVGTGTGVDVVADSISVGVTRGVVAIADVAVVGHVISVGVESVVEAFAGVDVVADVVSIGVA